VSDLQGEHTAGTTDAAPVATEAAAATPEAAVPEPEAEPGLEPDESASKPPSRALVRGLAVLAVLFLAGTVAMAVLAAHEHSRVSSTVDNRTAAEQVASRMASALVTFDYTKLDRTKATVISLATGKFRKEYEQAFGGLQALLTQTKARSTGVVKDVFLSSINDNTTTAVVQLDQTVEGSFGNRRQLDSYVQLSLVKVSGHWRVDDVTNLNFGQSVGQTPVPGGATTPTTSPPP